ncbi:hypothetical protein C2S53_000410 [Perilla frutescens var. hirtella]|uniref:Uncharacterized protein n=1 Tax=Perilla frutescens var. hirtella TaxID=608512 RepID=A0AAD4PG43_PERFH|nr:hypothetical protein C2S53_000410 [Perilla frutescens var. hirtella]
MEEGEDKWRARVRIGVSKKCKYNGRIHEECAEMGIKIRHPVDSQHTLIQYEYSSFRVPVQSVKVIYVGAFVTNVQSAPQREKERTYLQGVSAPRLQRGQGCLRQRRRRRGQQVASLVAAARLQRSGSFAVRRRRERRERGRSRGDGRGRFTAAARAWRRGFHRGDRGGGVQIRAASVLAEKKGRGIEKN